MQTNLTWLDLSFNKIQAIEGLSTLTRLQDLSLFSNAITTIEGLDNLPNLNVLSLGELLHTASIHSRTAPKHTCCTSPFVLMHLVTDLVPATCPRVQADRQRAWSPGALPHTPSSASTQPGVAEMPGKSLTHSLACHCCLWPLLAPGSNQLPRLECVSCLVAFSRLQLLNLAGNPLAKEPDYRGYVLSHLQQLRYLDYRCGGGGSKTTQSEAAWGVSGVHSRSLGLDTWWYDGGRGCSR